MFRSLLIKTKVHSLNSVHNHNQHQHQHQHQQPEANNRNHNKNKTNCKVLNEDEDIFSSISSRNLTKTTLGSTLSSITSSSSSPFASFSFSSINHFSSSNNNMNTTIARLISKRDWLTLEHCCADPNNLPPMDAPNITHAVTPDIVIHFAARFQAPLRTISLLSTLYPQSLERPDATGRYPIHVAAKWGATPDVIHFLICSNPTVVGIPDDLGKTPMHYVGECYARNYNRNCPYPVNDSMLQVVKLLKTAAPKSVNLEDHEGMNAIEYALESNADIKVIKSMQRACRDDWRDMKSHAGGKRHEELAREVVENAVLLQRQFSSRRGVMGSRGSRGSQEQQTTQPTHSESSSASQDDVSMHDVSNPASHGPQEDTTTSSRSSPGSSNMPIKIDVGRINFHRSTAQANTHAARTA